MIVLGQCVAAATLAMRSAITDQGVSGSLLLLAFGALLLLFGLWWTYFDFKDTVTPTLRDSRRSALIWAYSHYGAFAATAAVGAGLEVTANTLKHGSHVPAPSAAFLVGVPVALYILVVGRLRIRCVWTPPRATPSPTCRSTSRRGSAQRCRSIPIRGTGRSAASPRAAPQALVALAATRAAGMHIRYLELPGGHSWHVWRPGLADSLAWLATRTGLSAG